MRSSRAIVYLIVFSLLFAAASFAQLSEGGTPYSFSKAMRPAIDTRVMQTVDVNALLAEDEIEEQEGLPFRFGTPFDVNYNLHNSGTWEDLPDGSGLWRLQIESEGAISINLLYKDFFLPEGAKLHVYNGEGDMVIGAFTSRNNKDHAEFATSPVKGDITVLEYYEPAAVRGKGHFTVSRVVHAYKDIFNYTGTKFDKAFNSSGSCNNNINCPEGADWQNEGRAVAMVLLSGGTRWCSGAMVNNVRQDATPYFLTAYHCLGSETTWIFMFRYESPNCNNIDGPTYYTVQGSTLRASNSTSDFGLLELSEAPPDSFNMYFAGWTNDDAGSTTSTAIHHPSGDIKKISFDYDAVTSTDYLSTSGDSHWRVGQWEDGTTEGGSSGSPLFDQNHKIIGQLHGGYASCASITADWYGKFSWSWDYGGNASSRLRDWLDPDNTGATTLDGWDPYSGPTAPTAAFTGSPTSGEYPLVVDFSDQSTGTPTSWYWDFGDGVGTSTNQNPTYTYNSIGTYTVTMTATNAYGSDDEIKTDYINVTEQSETYQVFANADIAISGTVSGNYTATHTSDNNRQSIAEVLSDTNLKKAYSYLEHRWEFLVPGGTAVDFYVEASRPSNDDGDNFIFAYSTNGSTWYDLVTVASATEQVYTASMPADVSGTVYIRVTDSNRVKRNVSQDAVYVDHMYIEYSTVPQAPVANFSGSPTSGDYPLTVDFTDLSTGAPTLWSWDFGDGVGTSAAQNPSYTYNAAGTYTVSLTATNAQGSDGETKTDYITVTEPGSSYMYVNDMVVGRKTAGRNKAGTCTVYIVDHNSQAVAGATVYVTATGPNGGDYSGVTEADGSVYFQTANIKEPVGEWCFEVTDVTHASYPYSSSNNVVTRSCESGDVFKYATELLPDEFAVSNYPNPFNPSTTIEYTTPGSNHITIEVFNILGARVSTLVDEPRQAGTYRIDWDGTDQHGNKVASGIYLYRIQAGDFSATKKMLLLK